MKAFEAYMTGTGPFSGLGMIGVSDRYQWPMPKSASTYSNEWASMKPYDATVEMRLTLARLWQESPDQRPDLTRWIISDWGRVRGNSPQRLDECRRLAEMGSAEVPLQGIASLSKVMSIASPLRFPILDARVAAALNAIQIAAKEDQGCIFPYLPGRNREVGDVVKKRGFAFDPRFSPRQLEEKYGWTRPRRGETYAKYCEMMQTLSQQSAYKVYEIEMALFCDAEALVERAGRSEALVPA